MKKIIITLSAIMFSFIVYAQDSNVLIGLDGPAYGTRIKINFPGVTGGWARGYYVANQDNSTNFLGFGAFGYINNGIATMDYGWIGKNYDEAYMSFLSNGNIGIGSIAPTTKLEVVSGGDYDQLSLVKNTLEGDKGAGIAFKNVVNDGSIAEIGGIHAKLLHGGTGLIASSLSFYTRYNAAKIEAVTINPQGDMGIGTATPREKLSVNGKIRAKEIKVEATNWPDYVFEEGYKVETLAGLESYIKTNKHLPDMPTAKDIEVKGLELGEMVKLQQKKIEELTLHLIEKDKQINLLLKRMDALENKTKN